MTTTPAYLKESKSHLAAARRLFTDGQVLDASEAGWQATAAALKAVACQRGWEHDSVRQMHKAIDHLLRERDDPAIGFGFGFGHQLHVNSLEDWYMPAQVRQSLDEVADFVARMEAIATAS